MPVCVRVSVCDSGRRYWARSWQTRVRVGVSVPGKGTNKHSVCRHTVIVSKPPQEKRRNPQSTQPKRRLKKKDEKGTKNRGQVKSK